MLVRRVVFGSWPCGSFMPCPSGRLRVNKVMGVVLRQTRTKHIRNEVFADRVV